MKRLSLIISALSLAGSVPFRHFNAENIINILTTDCVPTAKDIVFLLDSSGSVSSNDFTVRSYKPIYHVQTALRSLANMTRSFHVGNNPIDTRFGFMLFDDKSYIAFNLNDYLSNDEVYNAILAANYTGGGTNIGSAMSTALSEIFVAPGNRPNVADVMIIITDGQDTSDTATPTAEARNRNITIYVMGMGSGVDGTQLENIAGDPENVYYLSEYGMLGLALSQVTCPEDPSIIDDSHDCSCNMTNMWLDVSILFESSKALDAAAMGEISGTLLGVFGSITVSQTVQQSSHVAVNTYSPNDTTSDLSTYQNSDDLGMRFALIAGQTSNLDPSDQIGALSQAIRVFDGPGRRTYARKVIIFVVASLSIGSDSDIVRLAQQFQANYGVFIVVNYVPLHLAPVPHVCDLASPGMCFIVHQASKDNVVLQMQSALCSANCFCKRNDYQYVSGTTDTPIDHAQCLHVVVAPTSWNAAHLICTSQNSLLTQVFDQAKMQFITNLSMQILGSDKTFVGLKYNDTAIPNDWYWETRNGFVQITGPADTMWNSGSPDRTLGDCVQLQASGGFNLKLTSTDCTTTYHSYTCQYDACDTDNFCPTALGADETAIMHMTLSQTGNGLSIN